MGFLGQFLRLFISPYFVAVVLLGVLYLRTRKTADQWNRALLTAVLLLLTVPAIPVFTYFMGRGLESVYPPKRLVEYPEADAILVLGGSALRMAKERPEPEEGGEVRLVSAYRLWKFKKAKTIIVAGGAPYEYPPGVMRTQADDMADVLIQLGVPSDVIIRERVSDTTKEDIAYSLPILKSIRAKKVLLVSTSRHLRRAMSLVQDEKNFSFTPVPVSLWYATEPLTWRSFIPTAGGLSEFVPTFKEYLGYLLRKV